MLWLLAGFGSLIELAEIPAIIILFYVYNKQRKKIVELEDQLQKANWSYGEPPTVKIKFQRLPAMDDYLSMSVGEHGEWIINTVGVGWTLTTVVFQESDKLKGITKFVVDDKVLGYANETYDSFAIISDDHLSFAFQVAFDQLVAHRFKPNFSLVTRQ